jgi:hypothetical protein
MHSPMSSPVEESVMNRALIVLAMLALTIVTARHTFDKVMLEAPSPHAS